jgi:polysaccharide deacetylase family protein (PEP-CTERM system associated)
MSFDVEDWPQSTWDPTLPITARAADNTRRLLDLLDDVGIRATMFVLGKFAARFPDVVRDMHRRGHEVASHGHGHLGIGTQSPKEFLDDVRHGKERLEQLIAERVTGYRAPDFSIVRETLWALEALVEAGFEYDSSIVPVRMARYGIADWPAQPMRVKVPAGGHIVEAPLPIVRWCGRDWPIGGGGYHRLLPGVVTRALARRAMAAAPFVFYCHPYEFDVRELQEIDVPLPWRVRLHQGLGRRWFQSRFTAFVRRFGGRRMCDALRGQRWPELDLTAVYSPAS